MLASAENFDRRARAGLNDEEFIALTPADTPPELRDLTVRLSPKTRCSVVSLPCRRLFSWVAVRSMPTIDHRSTMSWVRLCFGLVSAFCFLFLLLLLCADLFHKRISIVQVC